MLSEVSQSSKISGKMRKNKRKVKGTGFQFLLQSMDRDKENHVPNSTIHHNLIQSIQINPMMTAPVHSFTLSNNYTNGNSIGGNFYLENVKLLDKSDASQSDVNRSNQSKIQEKRYENCSTHLNKSKPNKIMNKNKNIQKTKYSDLIFKMKQYLTLTDELLNHVEDPSKWKFRKKTRLISQQLVSLITSIESVEVSQMNLSVKTTSFHLQDDLMNRSKGDQYAKIISSLEIEKEKLNSLISKHEMANIKMFIKINDGESEEIQKCKKQLAMLFEKYKKLEGLISSDKKKMVQILIEKEAISKNLQRVQQQNRSMAHAIERYKEQIERLKRQRSQLRNYQVSDKKIFNVSISGQNHLRQQSYPSFYDNSINSRDLQLESMRNSRNDSRISQQNAPRSSITTTASRIYKRNGGKLGINLNALFQNMTQQNLNQMAEDPEKFRMIINECKQTILQMENIITQQNKQLELSIHSLQEFKVKIDHQDRVIKSLEANIGGKEKEKQREQEREIKRQKQRWRQQQEREKQRLKQKDKNMKENRNNNQSEQKVKKPKQKSKIMIDNNKVTMDLNFNKLRLDQYRIIAMQAQALEEIVKKNKMK